MLVAIRAVHFGAVLLLFGGFVFLVFVIQPMVREPGASAPCCAVRRWVLRVAAVSVMLALLTAVWWLVLVAVQMSGRPWQEAWRGDVFGAVLDGTWFGHVWIVRFAIAAALAVLVAWALRQSANPKRLIEVAGSLAGLLLLTLALTGHAAASAGPTPLVSASADAVHLVAAGAWVGALPPFVFLLTRSTAAMPVVAAAARRLAALGIVSVTCLIASGFIGSVYLVGSVPALLGTPYGRLLTAKLALFALMLAFAASNRRRWTPMLDAVNVVEAQAALSKLRRNASWEILLAVVIVSIVGALGTAPPAAHEPIVWPLPFTLTWPDIGNPSGAQVAMATAAAGGVAFLSLAFKARGIGSARARIVGIGIALVVAAWLCAVPAHPTTYLHSPVRYTASSIARGSILYGQHCAACHGTYGYGDGSAAAGLSVKPPRLTTALLDRREGDLFWSIANGIARTAMPGFSVRISEFERWDVVNFMLAQADAEGAKTMDGSVEPWRGTVAPDFTFETEPGSQETLNQQRGNYVLLVLFTYPESMSRLCVLAGAKERLARAGIRLIAVPMNRDAITDAGRRAQSWCLQSMIAAGSDSDVVGTYTLFRRVPPLVVPAIATHYEFLIDRQGYLRARWIPERGYMWNGQDDLLRQVATMDRKPSVPDAPERPSAGSTLH